MLTANAGNGCHRNGFRHARYIVGLPGSDLERVSSDPQTNQATRRRGGTHFGRALPDSFRGKGPLGVAVSPASKRRFNGIPILLKPLTRLRRIPRVFPCQPIVTSYSREDQGIPSTFRLVQCAILPLFPSSPWCDADVPSLLPTQIPLQHSVHRAVHLHCFAAGRVSLSEAVILKGVDTRPLSSAPRYRSYLWSEKVRLIYVLLSNFALTKL